MILIKFSRESMWCYDDWGRKQWLNISLIHVDRGLRGRHDHMSMTTSIENIKLSTYSVPSPASCSGNSSMEAPLSSLVSESVCKSSSFPIKCTTVIIISFVRWISAVFCDDPCPPSSAHISMSMGKLLEWIVRLERSRWTVIERASTSVELTSQGLTYITKNCAFQSSNYAWWS